MPDEQQRRAPTSVPWGLSLWLAVLIVWATRMPFLPRQGPWELILTPPTGVLEIAGNLLLFAPLAFVVGRSMTERSGRRPSVSVLSLGLLTACVFIEAGQIFVRDRLVSPYDLGLNLSGGLVGLWAGVRAAGSGARTRRVADRAVLALVVLTYLGVLGLLGSRLPRARAGFQFQGWDESHEVRVAVEIGGSRAYRGEVERARICAGSAGKTVCVSDGASQAERRHLVRMVEESQSLSIAARVRSTSSRQYGPTRIVTFSDGPGRRNVTLGQSGDDLVLRLRTPPGGPNGTGFTFGLEDAVPVGEMVDVSIRVRDSTVRLDVETGQQERSAEYEVTPEWRLAWLIAGGADPGHPGQLWWAAVLGSLLVFVPPGLAAGWTLGRPDGVHAPLAGVAGSVAVSSPLVLVVPLGSASVWMLVAASLGAISAWTGDRDRRVWSGRHTRHEDSGWRN